MLAFRASFVILFIGRKSAARKFEEFASGQSMGHEERKYREKK